MGGATPINICLRQEVDRLQSVLRSTRSMLVDLQVGATLTHGCPCHIRHRGWYWAHPCHICPGTGTGRAHATSGLVRAPLPHPPRGLLQLAIAGTIVLNNLLIATMNSLFDATVPAIWLRISWEAASLGIWFGGLLQRFDSLDTWIQQGRPKTFWLTGFFNPQGFLTAMQQEVARKHQGWALDDVTLFTEVQKLENDDVREHPVDGVYIHGLFLEGCAWSKRENRLVDSAPKVLFHPLPILWVTAVLSEKRQDYMTYRCPCYRNKKRTDLNYIFDGARPTIVPCPRVCGAVQCDATAPRTHAHMHVHMPPRTCTAQSCAGADPFSGAVRWALLFHCVTHWTTLMSQTTDRGSGKQMDLAGSGAPVLKGLAAELTESLFQRLGWARAWDDGLLQRQGRLRAEPATRLKILARWHWFQVRAQCVRGLWRCHSLLGALGPVSCFAGRTFDGAPPALLPGSFRQAARLPSVGRGCCPGRREGPAH